MAATLKALGQPTFDHHRCQQCKGIQCRANTTQEQHHGKGLAGAREIRRHFDRRQGEDGHVERGPQTAALGRHEAERADRDDRYEKGDRETGTLRPEPVVALSHRHERYFSALLPASELRAGCA